MIELGNYNTLTIKRSTRVGLFLGDEDVDDLLLPNKYVPEDFEIGGTIRVFCYLDHEERPVATTLEPLITRDSFGFLEVAEVNQFGAFLNWGLEKHLLVPYREQTERMEKGRSYVVYCHLDPKSFRLVASARIVRHLDNTEVSLSAGDEVRILPYRVTDLGTEVIVNQRHHGLVFADQIFKNLEIGKPATGYIKTVRADNKLDVVLEPLGIRKLEPTAERIFTELKAAGGMLPLHDKSAPEAISNRLQMSKKLFKKGIGILYRERRIDIRDDGIHLL
ncbi:S1 RNA-binding domain-containing protein [Robiginitalea sp. SC105]|uniref:CvfB family protein n=1 Tax=Robiginitalea sp. SC105 TaxID=2762332 RepID=UPI00163B3125|nr:S1-like domain-containing RNA-binding protein [Robiginitalea sp. SC105]MBC2840709.1 GntR family transcriptional regulator [Robiginitalea sp. SC105]